MVSSIYIFFSPRKLGEEDSHFDDHIFFRWVENLKPQTSYWLCHGYGFHPSILRGSRRPTQMDCTNPPWQELFRIPYEAAESDAIRSLEDLEDGDPPHMGVS